MELATALAEPVAFVQFLPAPIRIMDGLRIDDITPEQIVDEICARVASDQRILVLNINANMALLAHHMSWLRDFLERAEIVFCDGAGVQWAARLLAGRSPARSTPPEWIGVLGQRLAKAGRSVFWLGGEERVVALAAERFAQATGIRTAGYHHGFFDHHPESDGNQRVLEEINHAQPDLLVVNMGMPVQERWLHDNWHALNVRAAITAGALVRHIAGLDHRPPRWVADMGVEWLVRLALEPRRLWRRYLLGLPRFGLLVGQEYIRRKLV